MDAQEPRTQVSPAGLALQSASDWQAGALPVGAQAPTTQAWPAPQSLSDRHVGSAQAGMHAPMTQ